jgi:hypothetical protein
MSEVRIALVAEGPTDCEVINAALRAILRRPFILTMIQPEATKPEFGGGWGGVLKWCHQVSQSGFESLDGYPPLSGFDLIVIHADADVASKSYTDCGTEVSALAFAQIIGSAYPVPYPARPPCPPSKLSNVAYPGGWAKRERDKRRFFVSPRSLREHGSLPPVSRAITQYYRAVNAI